MELTPEDKQRIEKANPYSYVKQSSIWRDGAEYATLYEREKEGERCPSLPECYAASKKLDKLEAERSELLSKLQERLDRRRKVSGYSSGFSDIHNEIDFLDLLLNSLKTK